MSVDFRQKIAILFVVMLAVSVAGADKVINIPPGTVLQVRIVERLSSETASVGDQFHGNLSAPVAANGKTLFHKGAEVTGEVVNVERSGRLSNPGELHLSLRTIRSGARIYAVDVPRIVIKGQSHAKSNVAKIGGTTAFGAIIGAMAGGGKGAAIGAGVGAAAGTAGAAATGKKAAIVESEEVLVWAMPSAEEQAAPPQPEAEAEQAEVQPQVREEVQPNVQPNYPPDYSPNDPSAPVERPDMRSEGYDGDRDEDGDYGRGGPEGFSTYDRRIISECFVDERGNLPPGLARRDHLPPGLERQVQRNGTLPPGLERRAQYLPDQCAARLPRLPRDWSRVMLGGRILLLDPNMRIVDLFWLRGD
jgi:hypothetical protein